MAQHQAAAQAAPRQPSAAHAERLQAMREQAGAFSYRYGNENGFLACRWCGTWHVHEAFNSEQLSVWLANRYCRATEAAAGRRHAEQNGTAPLQPSVEACEEHLANMSERRQRLLRQHGGDTAERLVSDELFDVVREAEQQQEEDADGRPSDEVFAIASTVSTLC